MRNRRTFCFDLFEYFCVSEVILYELLHVFDELPYARLKSIASCGYDFFFDQFACFCSHFFDEIFSIVVLLVFF